MLYFQVRRKAWADLVTLNSKKELNKLCDQFKAEGFAIIND